ncbi:MULTISPECIES: cysteine desulfurase family protein [Rhodomicrobium]|uniref:cysteine desulfurase family protein n=1 Tax=Rhodomicrobium TaxID=1068 RepID=UPI000B4BA3B7|nr:MULTISPECIES: cysteine desulfurase family protein [Rhodomicrobium]
MRSYLDHNATSPLRPEARDAMLAALALPGNASSVHAEGRAARMMVEDAREKVAALAGCPPRQVVFTGGGTEANVTALSPDWLTGDGPGRLFVSAIEHASVIRGGRFALNEVETLPVDSNGVIDLDAAREAFASWHKISGGAPFLVSLMLANNETGAVQPVAQMAERVHEFGGLLHSDAVQALGKLRVEELAAGADLISVSAHKFGGPKGAGALIVKREGLPVAAMLRGGGQERGYRAGTENIAAIAGFGAAAELSLAGWDQIEALRDRLEAQVAEIASGLTVFSQDAPRLPNTSCLAVAGLAAETLLIGLDLEGIAVSAGSACSSGKVARSHVLDAMGVGPELGAGAIRVSLGWSTTENDIERFIAAWTRLYGKFAERRQAA